METTGMTLTARHAPRLFAVPLVVGTLLLFGVALPAGAQTGAQAAAQDKAQEQSQDRAADQAQSMSAGLTSLITATPEEGFALAIKLSQKGVTTTQKNADVRKQLRPAYAHDPNSLIAVSHVIATHFQTIAAANNYWRK